MPTSPSRDLRRARRCARNIRSRPPSRACRWSATTSRLRAAFNTEGLPMNKTVSEAQLQSAVPATKPKGRPSRRTLLAAVAVVAGALAVWYGVYWWNVGRWMQTTDDAYVGGNTAPLATQVAGFVTEILFDDNQSVRRGQPLIRIDPRLYQAAVERAAA